jgi:predicted transcriptional regulator
VTEDQLEHLHRLLAAAFVSKARLKVVLELLRGPRTARQLQASGALTRGTSWYQLKVLCHAGVVVERQQSGPVSFSLSPHFRAILESILSTEELADAEEG